MKTTEYYYEDDRIKCRIEYLGVIHDFLEGTVYDENNNEIISFRFSNHYCSRLKLRAKNINQLDLITNVLIEYILHCTYYTYFNNRSIMIVKDEFSHIACNYSNKSTKVTFITLYKLKKENKHTYFHSMDCNGVQIHMYMEPLSDGMETIRYAEKQYLKDNKEYAKYKNS